MASSYLQRRVIGEDVNHAIKDAEEALQLAVKMRNWANVKKYADQLAKLDRDKFDQDGDADREKHGFVKGWTGGVLKKAK